MKKITLFWLLAAVMFSATASADWILKQETISAMANPGGGMNMPNLDPDRQAQTFYTRDNSLRMDSSDGSSMLIQIRGKKVSAYRLDNQNKTYSDMTQMLPMISMGALFFIDCNEQGQCQKRSNLITNKTSETRQVGSFTATRASMQAPSSFGMAPESTTSTVWMTRESKELIAEERTRMLVFANALAAIGMPGKVPELVLESYDDVAKQHGVSVETITDMGMMKSTTRTLSIEKKKLPDSLFSIPADYKQAAGMGMYQGMPPTAPGMGM